jgi:hypothetical protein
LHVPHPDYLKEILTEQQFIDWVDHFKRKPFGHWIDTEMRAQIAAGLSSNSFNECLPKVEQLRDLENEPDPTSIPGFGGAEEWLRKLNGK